MRNKQYLTKDALIRFYNSLKGKYLQQRDLADCLLKPIMGTTDWRNHLKFADQVGKFNTVPNLCKVYPFHLRDITPELFDWFFNHMDVTCVLGWSVYHQGMEFFTPPDENGFGALHGGLQDSSEHRGEFVKLPPVLFSSWDNPVPYIAVELAHEYALLVRFWRYDPAEKQLKLAGTAILLEWEAAPKGGVNIWTKVLGLGAAGCAQLEEGNLFEDLPHEAEEMASWPMAIVDLARRKSFDPFSYRPVWKVSGLKQPKPSLDSDPGNIKVFSNQELQKMEIGALQRAYDALWQKYLSQKITADYLLHYYADHPEYERPNCSEIYNNPYVPEH